jgi:cytochrome c oxidase cbb3-type subunit 3
MSRLQPPRIARVGLCIILLALLLVVMASAASAQEGDITRGSQIYDANCAVCHGSEGQGRVGLELSNDFPALDPNAFVQSVVEEGIDGTAMPPWSQAHGGPLTDQEIADVSAFVVSLSGGRSPMAPTATPLPVTPVPTVPGVSGDPGVGHALFVENCAMCHGDEGQGRLGANLNKAFASINPQQFVRSTVSHGIEGTAMPAWSVDQGGPLSEEQIDDISAFIMTLAPEQPQVTPTPTPPADAGGGASLLVIALIVLALVGLIVLVIWFSGRRVPEP